MRVDGGCYCGAVSYRATIDPARVSICHCTACQTLTGSPFRVTAVAARDSIELTGAAPKIFEKTGDSGRKRHMHFCGACGSPLFSSSAEGTGDWGIRWGSIRQREALTPTRQIWCGSAVPWIAEVPGLRDDGNP